MSIFTIIAGKVGIKKGANTAEVKAASTAAVAADPALVVAVSPNNTPVLPTGAATEATLATRATEAKLEAVRALLASLDAKDFATQTTLAAFKAAFDVIDVINDDVNDRWAVDAKITSPIDVPTGAVATAHVGRLRDTEMLERIEQQLKILVRHMECMTDEHIRETK